MKYKKSKIILISVLSLVVICGVIFSIFNSAYKKEKDTVSEKKLTSTLNKDYTRDVTSNTMRSEPNSIWSGYVASGKSFSSVEGRVKVPKVTCSTPHESVGFWAGFDGYQSQTVEQAGITATCDDASNYTKSQPVEGVTYYGWTMMYGAGSSQTFDFDIRPGDVIFYKTSFDKGLYHMTVTNESTGQTGSDTQKCNIETAEQSTPTDGCTQKDAEWIVERTGSEKLANFGTVVMYDNKATDQGVVGYIDDFKNVKTNLFQDEKYLSSTTNLSTKGSFSSSWLSSGAVGE